MAQSHDAHHRDPGTDLENFSGRLPIFPLPNLVLFPGMLVPLHIFEPRYRAMATDVLAGDRLIGMALLAPGWEKDYEGLPSVHPVVCVSRIVESTSLPDGRYNLVLLGLRRARLEEWIQDTPYRIARVSLLSDQAGDTASLAESTARLQSMVVALKNAGMVQGWDDSLDRPGPLTDVLAAVLPLPPERKQALLEELDVSRRASQMTRLLVPLYRQAWLLARAQSFRPKEPSQN